MRTLASGHEMKCHLSASVLDAMEPVITQTKKKAPAKKKTAPKKKPAAKKKAAKAK
jgi:hypothetical protein